MFESIDGVKDNISWDKRVFVFETMNTHPQAFLQTGI